MSKGTCPITLTKRMRQTLEAIPHEWTNSASSPKLPVLVKLEKRGLIEWRVDPLVHPNQALMNTFMHDHSHWQVRRKESTQPMSNVKRWNKYLEKLNK